MMASERQPSDAVLIQTNLAGALADIDEDPDSPDASWLTAPDNKLDTVLRAGFPTPSGNPTVGAGLQEFRLLVRAATPGGAGVPWVMNLYEGGSDRGQVASGTLAGTSTGTVLSGSWNAAALGTADGSAVECRIAFTGQGGAPANRNTGEVGALEWNVDFTAVTTQSRSGSLGAVLQKQALLALEAEGALKGEGLVRAATLDAALAALLGEAAALDAAAARTVQALAALDAAGKAELAIGAEVEAALRASLARVGALNVALRVTRTASAAADAGLLAQQVAALALEGAVARALGAVTTLGAALGAARAADAALDAVLAGLTALLVLGLDGALQSSPLRGALLDAWLNAGPAPSERRSFAAGGGRRFTVAGDRDAEVGGGDRVRIVEGERVLVVPAKPRRH